MCGDTVMWTITLKDGTVIDNLGHHGDIFVSEVPIDDSVFTLDNTSLMTINDGTTETQVTDLVYEYLIPAGDDVGKYVFSFRNKTGEEISLENIAQLFNGIASDNSDITEIQAAIIDLYELILSK